MTPPPTGVGDKDAGDGAAPLAAPWHHLPIRVYWEDTDAGGIVYYANYLRFAERARTEMVRAAAGGQSEILDRHGLVFAVRRVEVDYLAPARLDDLLDVATRITDIAGVRVTMTQEIRRAEQLLVRLAVTLVAVDRALQPARIPSEIRGLLGPMTKLAVVPSD